jgi:hypothetical protein
MSGAIKRIPILWNEETGYPEANCPDCYDLLFRETQAWIPFKASETFPHFAKNCKAETC